MLKTTWKPFWTIFPPLAVLPVVALTLVYHGRMTSFQEDLVRAEELAVEAQTAIITQKLERMMADVRILAAQNELADFLSTGDRAWLSRIAQEYLSVSRYAQVYDQIRYLDEQGMEVVRINFNDGHPAVVPESALQSKAGRYYFTEAMTLDAGQIYASPLDLNIENGVIERPYKPMIRVGTPVFDAHGHRRGIVLVNFLAQGLLNAVEKAGQTSPGDSMLLNSEGYWLLSPDPPPCWGFMFPDQIAAQMPTLYPQAWRAMNQAPSGTVETDEGLFTFRTVTPLAEQDRSVASVVQDESFSAGTYRWIVASHVSKASLNHRRTETLIWLMIVGATILVCLAFGVRALSIVFIERQHHHLHLERMARVDALTGIANRAAFEERLTLDYERARRHSRHLALLYIDLDGFKAINDTQGHQAGDQVLKDVAKTLATGCRREDLVGRYGGDEFAMLLTEPPDVATAVLVAEKIRERISGLRWAEQSVTASIGVALYPEHALDLLELIRLADAAMYASKASGKNSVVVAVPS